MKPNTNASGIIEEASGLANAFRSIEENLASFNLEDDTFRKLSTICERYASLISSVEGTLKQMNEEKVKSKGYLNTIHTEEVAFELRNNRGHALFIMGMLKEASGQMKEAAGLYEESASDIKEALSYKWRHLPSYAYLGNIQLGLGRKAEALRNFKLIMLSARYLESRTSNSMLESNDRQNLIAAIRAEIALNYLGAENSNFFRNLALKNHSFSNEDLSKIENTSYSWISKLKRKQLVA